MSSAGINEAGAMPSACNVCAVFANCNVVPTSRQLVRLGAARIDIAAQQHELARCRRATVSFFDMNTTTALTVELPENVSREEAQEALAIHLFQQGKVSLGQAATIAAQSKRAFIDALGREGVPVVNYPAAELRAEMHG